MKRQGYSRFSPQEVVTMHLSAVGGDQQFFIEGQEIGYLVRLFHMLIKPFLHIAIAIKIIVAFGGIAPKQKSVFLGAVENGQ